MSENSEKCLQIACFVQPTDQKPKDIYFTIIDGKENQKIWKFERLEEEKLGIFFA